MVSPFISFFKPPFYYYFGSLHCNFLNDSVIVQIFCSKLYILCKTSMVESVSKCSIARNFENVVTLVTLLSSFVHFAIFP